MKESNLDKLIEFIYRTSDCEFCKSIGFSCNMNDPEDDVSGDKCRGYIRENIINSVKLQMTQN